MIKIRPAKKSNAKKQKGFTMIEGVFVIFVFTVLAYGITALVSSLLTNSAKQEALVYNADQARRISFQIMKELRNASTSSIGSYAIAEAEAQELTFFSNIDSDSGMERIRYFIQNGVLRRGVIDPAGNPLSYNPASEVVADIQNNVGNQANPLFYYYDDEYDGVTDDFLPQPVSVTDVRYVRMDLKIFNRAGISNSATYTVTAGGAIRNLKTN